MKRLIIADLKSNNNHGTCTGHYYSLAQNYIDLFQDCYQVLVASGPIYLKRFEQDRMMLLPFDYIAGHNRIRNLYRMLRNAYCLFKFSSNNDIVVVQDSQPYMILLSLIIAYRNNCRLFQIHYSDEPMNRWFYRVMMKFFRHKLNGVICPNTKVGKAYGVPFVVVPDYIWYDKNAGRCFISYSERIYDFCIVGRIAKDKGVSDAVRTICKTGHSILVAGQIQEAEEGNRLIELASKYHNITLDLTYINDEKYYYYISHSRYCILNYCGTYTARSSGVVLDTLFFGTPVIGTKCRALQLVEDYHVGVLYENIEDFQLDPLFNISTYDAFLSSIIRYRNLHQTYKEKLEKFLCN